MYYIALRMLFGDRAKYLLLICALSFSSLLITQQGAVFCGLLRWTTAPLRNSKVKIWVTDPKVQQVNDPRSMRDTDLFRVRSVPGVEWAMPLSWSLIQARLPNGIFKGIQLIGLDAGTLAGAPPDMIAGSWKNIYESSAVVIDQVAVEKFSEGYPDGKVGVGDFFDINDNDARIVGICHDERTFFGYPLVYTTYERANEFQPPVRNVLSYVICEPSPGLTSEEIARRIEEQTGLKAYTEYEFEISTLIWFFYNTGIPISFGTTVILGFVVGIAVAGQTFYSFILENLTHFGALKAMGASNNLLMRMMVIQACTVGFLGYGIGLGLTALFGKAVQERGNPPFYLPDQLVIISFFAIVVICTFSVIMGLKRITKVEPAEVFRG